MLCICKCINAKAFAYPLGISRDAATGAAPHENQHAHIASKFFIRKMAAVSGDGVRE